MAHSTSPATTTHPILTPPPSLVPPLTALLHPTLLEKMRLGSPSTAHTDLSTLNRYQTDNEINETFYQLQKASPFPKLPVYFVHQSAPGDTEREAVETSSARGIPKAPRFGARTGGIMSHSRAVPNTAGSDTPLNTPAPDSSSVRQRVSSMGSVGEDGAKDTRIQVEDGTMQGAQGRASVCAVRTEEELPTRAWHIPEYEDT